MGGKEEHHGKFGPTAAGIAFVIVLVTGLLMVLFLFRRPHLVAAIKRCFRRKPKFQIATIEGDLEAAQAARASVSYHPRARAYHREVAYDQRGRVITVVPESHAQPPLYPTACLKTLPAPVAWPADEKGENRSVRSGSFSGCSICIEDVRKGTLGRQLPCGHIFHASCVDPWLTTKSPTCPLCRSRFVSQATNVELPRPPPATAQLETTERHAA